MDRADLLRHWRLRCHRAQHAHYISGRIYERRHYCLGVPSVILSAIVGTTVFASLVEFSESNNMVVLTVAIGLLSIFSGVLTSLQTFLDYKALAERHRLSGSKFADLRHRIEVVATFSGDKAELKASLLDIENAWKLIREESPNFPGNLWAKVEADMTLEKDLAMYPEFGKGLAD